MADATIRTKLILDTSSVNAGASLGGTPQNPTDPNNPIFHLKKMSGSLDDVAQKLVSGSGIGLGGIMQLSALVPYLALATATIIGGGFLKQMIDKEWPGLYDLLRNPKAYMVEALINYLKENFPSGGKGGTEPYTKMSVDPNAPKSWIESAIEINQNKLKPFESPVENAKTFMESLRGVNNKLDELEENPLFAKEMNNPIVKGFKSALKAVEDYYDGVKKTLGIADNFVSSTDKATESTGEFSSEVSNSVSAFSAATTYVKNYTSHVMSSAKALDSEINKIKEKNSALNDQINKYRALASAMVKAGIKPDVAVDLAERGFSVTKVRAGVDLKYEKGRLIIGESNLNLGKGGKIIE